MNFIERVKNILLSPKTEWNKIATEEQSFFSIAISYVLPLSIIGAICAFVGYGFIGYNFGFGYRLKGNMDWGYYEGISRLSAPLLGFIISTFIVDALAPTFKSEKNINRSAQLVGYSITPLLVGGIFYLLPSLAKLPILCGVYGIYLMYAGIAPLKKVPEDQNLAYMIVSTIIYAVITGIILYILHSTLDTVFDIGWGRFPLG